VATASGRATRALEMFIDSHAHLDSADFDSDRLAVIRRARDAQVDRVLAIGSGTGPGTAEDTIRLAEQFENLDASIGIHPHEAVLATDQDLKGLAQLAGHRKVVAWGEIGLDFHYDHSPRDVQTRVFARQLGLASETSLPVIIHTREAEPETLEILKAHWSDSNLGGVLHCYSGTWQLAQACLDMGFCISFSGLITFPKAENLRDIVKQIPLDRLLIETDSPFLAPVPYRGKRNEPAFVVETAKVMAHLKNVSLEELGAVTKANYYRLFGPGNCH
jgi:TatD DNase family protein